MIRLGVMGAGLMGSRVVETALTLPDVEVAVVADSDPDRAARVAEPAGATVAAGFRELVTAEGLDAVYVGLPHHLHAEAIVAAADRGLHLLVDKPLCTTLAEADDIERAVEAAGVTLMMGFSHRFHVELAAARTAIARGDLGAPLLAADLCVEAAPATPDWYWRTDLGGGVLQLQAHHCLDRLCWLLDTSVDEVWANVASRQGDADDAATIGLRFANGALGQIGVAFGRHVRTAPVVELVIQGSHGLIRLETWSSVRIETRETAVVQTQQRDDWLRRELREFVDALRERRAPIATLADGRRALRYAVAAVESARTGRPVDTRA